MNDPLMGRQVGDYRIIAHLGEGGMGMVYKGQHAALGQIVAVKSLHSTLMGNQSAKDRFVREAEALARLNHPNIIKLLNFVNNEQGCFIIMEFAEGEDIEVKLQRMGLIPPEQCIPWFIDACRGLQFAHGQNIIHRDIKPSNILVHPSGTAKLLDFGTAKLVDAKRLTQQGMTLGTIIYMSKEQLLGKPLDARSDVYSLGVTLYECVTGKLPFYDEEERKLVVKIAKETPIPPRQHYPYVSEQLEAMILKAMAKDPAQRFQTADEMANTLATLVGGAPIAVQSGGQAAATPPIAQTAPGPVPAPGAGGGGGGISILAIAGAGLALLGLGIGIPFMIIGKGGALTWVGLVLLLVLLLGGVALAVFGLLKAQGGGGAAAPAAAAPAPAPAPAPQAPAPQPAAPPPPPMAPQPMAAPPPQPMAPQPMAPQAGPMPASMAFNPGGTLNVNSANAAQQYGQPATAAPAAGAPPAPAGTAVLKVIDGSCAGRHYQVLPNGPCTIGRAPNCVAVINDPGVSGQHASVGFDGRSYFVQDLGSRNGVFVNNQKVTRHPLASGDLLVIGSTRIMVGVG
ncbi:FHA domain-containing serine/threonine-protein kinase [Planctomycetota bacterium]|nr:FHA domain-containing serine/threonine-protein kinase [Planctomycetota bacterium]